MEVGRACGQIEGLTMDKLAFYWTPNGRRNVERPLARWEDSFVDFFCRSGQEVAWYMHAQDRMTWRKMESECEKKT